MHLRIRFFASCAEAVGKKELRMKVEDGMRLGELKDRLAALHPSLTPLYPSLAFAVNGEMTKMDAVLRDGDEVSFLPPVSGGLTVGKAGRF